MVQKVFNRYEKKYMLSPSQYEQIRERLNLYMEEDSYGLHNIRNIYFDTDDNELIRQSIEKPKYKEKFRIRCYGAPGENTDIFLEIKKKYKGLVNKRRITLPRVEAQEYLLNGKKPAIDSQIFREIDYFLQHYDMGPKLYLAYDRIALFGKEDAEFRVTFDINIRSRSYNLDLSDDTDTEYLLEEGYRLMEVKILNAMPRWFLDILNDLNIRDTSFSKYGSVYQNNLARGMYSYAKDITVTQKTSVEGMTYRPYIPGLAYCSAVN